MRLRDAILAALGWCCVLAFAFELARGRGKSIDDYAVRVLTPLPIGMPIEPDDAARVLWSGWTAPKSGSRTSIAADPDIVFTSSLARRNCSVTLTAFPELPAGLREQRVRIALNGSTSSDTARVAAAGTFRFTNVGDVFIGANRFTLRLPDARKLSANDERVGALGLRSIAISCGSD